MVYEIMPNFATIDTEMSTTPLLFTFQPERQNFIPDAVRIAWSGETS